MKFWRKPTPMISIFSLLAIFCSDSRRLASANDNGLALTPPMGWRSWNQYGRNVNQKILQNVMDGMVDQSRFDHRGHPTSLCDLGYCDVGLDDAWQLCGANNAAPGMNYHDIHGNPIVNLTRFPSLKKMTDHAHSLNLTAGFYGNNCICHDKCRNDTECDTQIKGDVKAFLNWGFDSWKLDGCGKENNMRLFDHYIRQMSNKSIMVESCHWGVKKYDPNPNLPPREGCPFNFYRSSGDINLSYGSMMHNLKSVERYRSMNASYPGCWAYPDMLEIGIRRRASTSDGERPPIGLTRAESRSHFGAWCIVSSPLILGHDVHDKEATDHIWDIVSNREAIAVNKAYAGDSGGVYEMSTSLVHIDETSFSTNRRLGTPAAVPSYKYLSKPLGGANVAVLLMNGSFKATNLTATFSDIPDLSCDGDNYSVRNIWTHTDEGTFRESWSATVAGHDAAFIVVSCDDA